MSLGALLLDPPHGLLRQSWAPRRQRYGAVNADGFGVGWYDPSRSAPARYRRDVPMWTDPSFASLAGVVRSACVLAAVRSATAGTPLDESACAPFLLRGQVLLSHNGAVPDAARALGPLVTAAALAAVGSTVDSAFLAAQVTDRLAAGDALADALRATVLASADRAPTARLNLLATDGRSIAATTWGDTLFWRRDADAVVVASEPSDDAPGWEQLPDRSFFVVDPDLHTSLRPLENGSP